LRKKFISDKTKETFFLQVRQKSKLQRKKNVTSNLNKASDFLKESFHYVRSFKKTKETDP